MRGAGGLGAGAIMRESGNTSIKGLICGSSANHLLNRVQCKCLVTKVKARGGDLVDDDGRSWLCECGWFVEPVDGE